MEFVGANSFARNCLNVRMNSHPHLLLFLGSGLGYYTRQHGIARHSFVSIPFHSGLGYYLPTGKKRRMCRSQSLFIQGWGTTVWCHFLLCLQNVEIVIRGFLAS